MGGACRLIAQICVLEDRHGLRRPGLPRNSESPGTLKLLPKPLTGDPRGRGSRMSAGKNRLQSGRGDWDTVSVAPVISRAMTDDLLPHTGHLALRPPDGLGHVG